MTHICSTFLKWVHFIVRKEDFIKKIDFLTQKCSINKKKCKKKCKKNDAYVFHFLFVQFFNMKMNQKRKK